MSQNHISKNLPFILLGSRFFMFLIFQSMIAVLADSWSISEKYWLLTATLTNLVSILILYFVFRSRNDNYLRIFSFSRISFKRDILIFALLMLLAGPLAFLPNYFLSILLWGNPEIPVDMMFQPIESWLIYILIITFPVTIALAELATYFAYIMPGLNKQLKSKWLAVLLPVVFLSIQHCTLPFIPDARFILYRALVFLPFALLIGISIYKRPTLFPYFAVIHGVMDAGTAFMFLGKL